MQLTVDIRGDDVAAGIDRELAGMAAASVKAQRYVTNNTKVRLRQATAPGLGPRVANAWRSEAYENAQAKGVDSRGMVWTRAPDIIASAEDAPLIRAHNGLFLSIPTPAAGTGPGGRRIRPNEFKKRTGIPLRPIRGRRGTRLLVAQEQGRSRFKRGPGGRLIGRQRGGGFATKSFVRGKAFVVVFILVRQVQMRKLLDRGPIADQGAEELADFLAATLNAAS